MINITKKIIIRYHSHLAENTFLQHFMLGTSALSYRDNDFCFIRVKNELKNNLVKKTSRGKMHMKRGPLINAISIKLKPIEFIILITSCH